MINNLIKIGLLYLLYSTGIEIRPVHEQDSIPKQTATIYCRYKHKDNEKAVFSFGHDLGDYHLIYGTLIIDGDSDYFKVMGDQRDNKSRIMDLGEKEWDEVDYIPMLPFRPICPETGGSCSPTRLAKPDETGKILSDVNGHDIKVIAGHVYLVHVQCERKGDFYAMLRVDGLKKGDRCTISWKIIPSPE